MLQQDHCPNPKSIDRLKSQKCKILQLYKLYIVILNIRRFYRRNTIQSFRDAYGQMTQPLLLNIAWRYYVFELYDQK